MLGEFIACMAMITVDPDQRIVKTAEIFLT